MKAGSLALEGWWSWWVDKEDPIPYSKEIVRPFQSVMDSAFCFLASPFRVPMFVLECDGAWKESEERRGCSLGLVARKKKPATSTKWRVNWNMPQNRLGRTLKPDTNLLPCFKASSVHPPPSYPCRISPPPPRYEIVLSRLGLNVGQADGCSACSPVASCFSRNRGCTCPCPSSRRRGSALRSMRLCVCLRALRRVALRTVPAEK